VIVLMITLLVAPWKWPSCCSAVPEGGAQRLMTSDTDARRAPSPTVDRPDRSRPGPVRSVLREALSWPTALVCLLCLVLGVPATILLTPDQDVVVAGQHLSVGARPPSMSISGPAQLVQLGNTQLDIAPLHVYGPLRPRLILGPVQRNAAAAAALEPGNGRDVREAAVTTITDGFVRWYAWAALILLALTAAVTAVVSCVRMLVTLRRQTRSQHRPLTPAEIWHRSSEQIRGVTISAVIVTMLGWGAAGALAYTGAVNGLAHVSSLSDLVGTYYVTPSPVGPTVHGYAGAVIGDSRAARAGGPLVDAATDDDKACARSADSLANEIGTLIAAPVANLACTGASITAGLRGPQIQGGQVLPPQVGLLKQIEGLRFVVVVIGPNDVSWTDQLRYCYSVANCQDNLTRGEFGYRLAAFDRDYGNLLHDLNDLPGGPQIIVMTSYDVFTPDATCPDARGPIGTAGLNSDSIRLLVDRTRQLNDVLIGGADKYSYFVAEPSVTPLCEAGVDQLGPDLQGLNDSSPFHPTGIGMIRLASSIVRLIAPAE